VDVNGSSIKPSARVRVRNSTYSNSTYTAPVNYRNLECCSCPSVAKRPRISEIDIFCTDPTTDISKRPFQPSSERQYSSVVSLPASSASNSPSPVTGRCAVNELSVRSFSEELVDEVTEGEFSLQAPESSPRLKFTRNKKLSFDKLVERVPLIQVDQSSAKSRCT